MISELRLREFYKAFGVQWRVSPELPAADDPRRGLRRRLLREEFEEYLEAEEHNDIVGIADALADMKYIIEGTALEYGIPLSRVFAEVHRSNMSKLEDGKPLRREDGKILKGRDYTPPDIKRILDEEINP